MTDQHLITEENSIGDSSNAQNDKDDKNSAADARMKQSKIQSNYKEERDIWGANSFLKNDSRFDFVVSYLSQAEHSLANKTYEVVESTADLYKTPTSSKTVIKSPLLRNSETVNIQSHADYLVPHPVAETPAPVTANLFEKDTSGRNYTDLTYFDISSLNDGEDFRSSSPSDLTAFRPKSCEPEQQIKILSPRFSESGASVDGDKFPLSSVNNHIKTDIAINNDDDDDEVERIFRTFSKSNSAHSVEKEPERSARSRPSDFCGSFTNHAMSIKNELNDIENEFNLNEISSTFMTGNCLNQDDLEGEILSLTSSFIPDKDQKDLDKATKRKNSPETPQQSSQTPFHGTLRKPLLSLLMQSTTSTVVVEDCLSNGEDDLMSGKESVRDEYSSSGHVTNDDASNDDELKQLIEKKIVDLKAQNQSNNESLDKIFEKVVKINSGSSTATPKMDASCDMSPTNENAVNEESSVMEVDCVPDSPSCSSKDMLRDQIANELLQYKIIQKSTIKTRASSAKGSNSRPQSSGSRKRMSMKNGNNDKSLLFQTFRPLSAGAARSSNIMSNHIPVSHDLHRSRVAAWSKKDEEKILNVDSVSLPPPKKKSMPKLSKQNGGAAHLGQEVNAAKDFTSSSELSTNLLRPTLSIPRLTLSADIFAGILDLPDEILLQILNNLSQGDLIRAAQVCKRFREVAHDRVLWGDVKANEITIDNDWLEFIGKREPVSFSISHCDGHSVTPLGLRKFFKCCRNSLKHIHVDRCSGNYLSGDMILLHASCHASQLRSISVPWSVTSDNGITAIALAINGIEEINIVGNCQISDESVEILLTRHAKTLRVLEIAGCFAISELLVVNLVTQSTNLTKLNIGLCSKLRTTGLLSILDNVPNLRHLDVHGLKFLDDRCVHLISTNCKKLHTLNLSNCLRISDIALSELATYASSLRVLDVANCSQITDFGIINLVNMNRKITSLDLTYTGTTCTGVEAISQNLILSLKVLRLSFCRNITQTCLEKLAADCTKLTSLHIYGCKRVKLQPLMKINKYAIIEK